MRTALIRFALVCCLTAAATLAPAQTRKPGLWDMSTTMTWQQSPLPNGMAMPGGGSRTTQVCLTQEQIDKYGAYIPQQNPRQSCQMTNVNKTATSMTGDMVCTGAMNGTAKVQATWTDDGHATGSVHFTGSMQMGSTSKPVEWTTNTSSTYKGAACGNVKPIVIPDSK